MAELEALLDEARGLDFSAGWGTGIMADRMHESPPPWDWSAIVADHLAGARSALDLGTGDGLALLGYGTLPPLTVAQEAWAETLDAARRTLGPHGVPVVHSMSSPENTDDPDRADWPGLPFRDGAFDVVLSRHECFSPREVRRILRPGGWFLTQQVSGDTTLRALLGLPASGGPPWDLATAVAQVESAGLRVTGSGEARSSVGFADVGALAAFLRAVPWEVPEFTIDRFADTLARLHREDRPLTFVQPRFWLAAVSDR